MLEDLFQKFYTDFENVYEVKKYINNIQKYNLDSLDKYFNHNCSSFVNQIFVIVQALVNNPSKETYRSFFIQVCEMANIFQSKNYKHIFSMLFEITQIGMNEINDHSYSGLISHIIGNNFPKRTMIFLFMYYHIFEILSFRVQRESYIKISELIDTYLLIGFIIYYIASFIFILIIVLVYIYRFNKNYYKLNEMKKVFKICNKRE